MRRFQEMVPPGEPLLVWTVTQFQFDYRRSPIIEMNVEGLAKPWARIPAGRYVLWQYQGYTVNTPDILYRDLSTGRHTGAIDARALDVVYWLQDLVSHAKALLKQDGIVLVDIGEHAPPPPDTDR